MNLTKGFMGGGIKGVNFLFICGISMNAAYLSQSDSPRIRESMDGESVTLLYNLKNLQ